MKKLYVGNLSFKATEEQVQALFAEIGVQPDALSLLRDRFTGQPRGFGFAEVHDDAEAEKAIAALNGTTGSFSAVRLSSTKRARNAKVAAELAAGVDAAATAAAATVGMAVVEAVADAIAAMVAEAAVVGAAAVEVTVAAATAADAIAATFTVRVALNLILQLSSWSGLLPAESV